MSESYCCRLSFIMTIHISCDLFFCSLLRWSEQMQVKKQALTHRLSAVSPSGSCRSAALLTDHLSYLLQSAQHASWQDQASNESPGRTNNGLWCWGYTETQKHKHTPEHWVCARVCLKGAATDLSKRSKKSESFPLHNK